MQTQHLINYNLDKVYVGMSREQFSVVEFNHLVVSVCQMFGQFVKFIVVVSEVEEEELASKSCRLDASDNEPICLKVPSFVSKEKNRKDGLYNDLVKFCSAQKVGWEEPDSIVKGLFQTYQILYGILIDTIVYCTVTFVPYHFLPILLDTIGQNKANIGRDLSPI